MGHGGISKEKEQPPRHGTPMRGPIERKRYAMRQQLGGRARARTRTQVIDILASRFEVDESGCWLWTGRLTNAGYAGLTWKPGPAERIHRGGHRVIWRALGMPVPDELVVDHLCRVRHCINPDHMEWVTQRENVMRSPITLGFINSSKTHCSNGHEYSASNTTVFRGQGYAERICKTCVANRDRARREAAS